MNKAIFLGVFLLVGCGGEDESARTLVDDPAVVEPILVPGLECLKLSTSCEACTRPTDQLLCNLQVGVNDEDSCNTANDYFYEACVIDPCAELAETCAFCTDATVLAVCQTVLSVGDPALCAEEQEEYFTRCLD